jgi:nicotinamide-nucleotide amidase
VTGVAGPGGGTGDKPVGLVHLAIQDADGVLGDVFRFPGDRRAVRARTVAWALDRLRRRFAGG